MAFDEFDLEGEIKRVLTKKYYEKNKMNPIMLAFRRKLLDAAAENQNEKSKEMDARTELLLRTKPYIPPPVD